MTDHPTFFIDSGLPPGLIDNLRRLNPWWEGEAMPVQPVTRRHLVAQMRRRLDAGIAPVVGVRGPRQIGKTTAQFQIIQDLLAEEVDPRRVLRVQFDDLPTLGRLQEPILRISDWFEQRVAPGRFNSLARAGEPVYLFFDEVQNLDRWDVQLKSLVDNASVKVVVTGSSALRIELGRDSLAGRINTIEAGVLSLTEIGALRELETPPPFLRDNGLPDLLEKEFWAGLRDCGVEHERRAGAASGSHPLGGPPGGEHLRIRCVDDPRPGHLHFPQRGTDQEVDFVLTVGGARIPVEVKYQRRIDPLRDTLGLRSFLEKSVNNAPFGVLVTQDDSGTVDDPRIVSMPLSTFMMLR